MKFYIENISFSTIHYDKIALKYNSFIRYLLMIKRKELPNEKHTQ